MKSSLSPQQAFLIYSMLFGSEADEREPQQSKVGLDAKPRDALVALGLLRKEKRRVNRGSAMYLIPTQKAWDWAAENLGTDLMKSVKASRVLETVLRCLRPVVGTSGAALLSFVHGSAAPQTDETLGESSELSSRGELDERIRSAYLELTKGAFNQRVLLKDLRPRIDAAKQDVDRVLMRMQVERKVVLMGLDNPSERTAQDEQAALHIAGNPRHLVYLKD